MLIFVFLSGVLEVQLLDTANLSLDSPDLDDAALDGGDSSVFLFSNVQLTQQVRLDYGRVTKVNILPTLSIHNL